MLRRPRREAAAAERRGRRSRRCGPAQLHYAANGLHHDPDGLAELAARASRSSSAPPQQDAACSSTWSDALCPDARTLRFFDASAETSRASFRWRLSGARLKLGGVKSIVDGSARAPRRAASAKPVRRVRPRPASAASWRGEPRADLLAGRARQATFRLAYQSTTVRTYTAAASNGDAARSTWCSPRARGRGRAAAGAGP